MRKKPRTANKQAMRQKTMAAGLFKAKCLAVMDEVQARHQSIVITKRGKPVVKLVPVESNAVGLFNFMEGKGRILGDIVAPAVAARNWELD